MDNGQLRNLHTNELRRCSSQLRPVRKETVDYYMLRDSIRDLGILQPVLVRPMPPVYEVVAGSHRYECAVDLKLETIPCVVKELTDREVLRVQVVENAGKIATNPVDYVRRLQKIVQDGDMTIEELAFSVHCHPDWVRRLLSLNHLSDECKQALSEKRISTKLGIELAKLPVHDQNQLLLLSEATSSREMLEIIRSAVREKRTDRFTQRRANDANLLARPTLRKGGTLYDEYVNRTSAATMLMRADAQTPLDGWNACIDWVMCMDADTVAERVARRKRAEHLEARIEEQRNLEMKVRQEHEQ